MAKNPTEYIAYVKNGNDELIIRWDKEDNLFYLEERDNVSFVVIYKEAINDLLSEISKLKELMDEDKEKRRPKR